jgi:hypothetical protein
MDRLIHRAPPNDAKRGMTIAEIVAVIDSLAPDPGGDIGVDRIDW